MAKHLVFGKAGELAAADYLKKEGYTILHTNWRSGHRELDIVAQTGDELVIVEVKSRTAKYPLDPERAVNTRKIRNLVTAANIYIRLFDIDMPVRFDVVTVTGKDPNFNTVHIVDAFRAPMEGGYYAD
ncbi:MAG: YraN family protein [Dysgonamonadaceae bacterium]|nr:YraN family protein [Dysgonamonadaceae bacterium]